MKFTRSLFVIALPVLAACLPLFAQQPSSLPENYITLLRSDVKAEKTEIIQQNLTLTDQESQKFWPIERDYEHDLSKLNDQRVQIIRDYAANWDSLSEENALDLSKRTFKFQKDRVELRQKYFERIAKAVSPAVSAKFFQIENQLENLVDLEIASSIPLVK